MFSILSRTLRLTPELSVVLRWTPQTQAGGRELMHGGCGCRKSLDTPLPIRYLPALWEAGSWGPGALPCAMGEDRGDPAAGKSPLPSPPQSPGRCFFLGLLADPFSRRLSFSCGFLQLSPPAFALLLSCQCQRFAPKLRTLPAPTPPRRAISATLAWLAGSLVRLGLSLAALSGVALGT